MKSDMDLIVEKYLHLTEFAVSDACKIKRTEYIIPDVITSRKSPRKVKPMAHIVRGYKTSLPRLHFMAALFLRNEILGCMQQAVDREGLLRNFRKEFPGLAARVSRNYAEKFSSYIAAYNKGRLYKNQLMPPLFAFSWTKNGYIRHPTFHLQHIGFNFIKRMLTTARFADPRFFDLSEIARIRDNEEQYPDWHVPGDAEITRIESEIKKPLFNVIEFPSGYGKDYDTQ